MLNTNLRTKLFDRNLESIGYGTKKNALEAIADRVFKNEISICASNRLQYLKSCLGLPHSEIDSNFSKISFELSKNERSFGAKKITRSSVDLLCMLFINYVGIDKAFDSNFHIHTENFFKFISQVIPQNSINIIPKKYLHNIKLNKNTLQFNNFTRQFDPKESSYFQIDNPQENTILAQTFHNVSPEVDSMILDYSDDNSLRQLGEVSKRYYKSVREKNNSSNKVYYAIGNPISLFTSEIISYTETHREYKKYPADNWRSPGLGEDWDSNTYQKLISNIPETVYYTHREPIYGPVYRTYFTHAEIQQSFQLNNIHLFDNYLSAKNYTSFNYKGDSIPAVFLIEVNRLDIFKMKKTTKQITKQVFDSPHLPDFVTPANNISRIYSSKFKGEIFNSDKSNEEEFETIWDKKQNNSLNTQEVVIAEITALFKNYSNWHSRFTRHNQKQVELILHEVQKNTNIVELKEFLDKLYDEASKSDTINQKGHYVRMLNFAIEQLKILQVPDIMDYLYK